MPSRPPDPIINNFDIDYYSAAATDAIMVNRLLLEKFRQATLDSGLYWSPSVKQLLQSDEFWEGGYVADFMIRNQHRMGFRPRQEGPSPTRANMTENDPSWFTESMKKCRGEELKEKKAYEPWYSGSTHDHQQTWPMIQSGVDFTKLPRLPAPARKVPPSDTICVGKPAPHDPVFAFGSSGEYYPSSDRPAAHPAIRSLGGDNAAPVAPMCVTASPGIKPSPPSCTANDLVYAFGSSGENSSSHGVAPPRPAGPSGSSYSHSKSDRSFAQAHRAGLSAPAVPEVNPHVNQLGNNWPQAAGTVNHNTNNAFQRAISPADSGYSTITPSISPVPSKTPRPQSAQNSNFGINPTFANNPQIQYPLSQAHLAPGEGWFQDLAAVMAQPEIPAQEEIIAAPQMVHVQPEVYTQQELPVKTEVPALPKPRRGRPPGTGGRYKQRAKKGDNPAVAGGNNVPKTKRAKRPAAAGSK